MSLDLAQESKVSFPRRRESSILNDSAHALPSQLTPSSSGLTRGPISHLAPVVAWLLGSSPRMTVVGVGPVTSVTSSVLDSRLRGNDTVGGLKNPGSVA